MRKLFLFIAVWIGILCFWIKFQPVDWAQTHIFCAEDIPCTMANFNGVLYVGTGPGQYASLQAAHDASPAGGGTVVMSSTATLFGASNTTTATISKPINIVLGCAVYTYSGAAAQAISIVSANGVTIEGCGNANGQPAGGTANGGSQIVVTNTTVNGIDAAGAPGLVLQNFTVLGPNSGTGKCIILTGNSSHLYDINCRAFGSDGVRIDGTRGNSNNVSLDRVGSISNGGWGFNVFGVNGNLIVFNHTSGSNNALGNYQVATSTNVFLGAHSQTSSTGIGVTFPSGGSNNWGNIYSEVGDEATAVAFAAGANNNFIYLSSQVAFTNAGTNNSIFTSRLLMAAVGAASPGYSFIGNPSTGFYDVGGGSVGFSSGGTPSFLYNLNIHRMGVNGVFGWSSNADPTAAGNDTGLSHGNTGLVAVGTGTAGSRAGKLTSAMLSSDGGANCTNGELALSAGWQSTGSATVTGVQGAGAQTCMWVITTGTTTAANPTVTDTLTTTLVSAGTVCEMNIHGGTGATAATMYFLQTSFSTTAPIFTFQGTPTAGGTTYFVTRRCGP